MTVTKEKVKEKAQNPRDMLKHHPLTPELALDSELFMSIGVGVSARRWPVTGGFIESKTKERKGGNKKPKRPQTS